MKCENCNNVILEKGYVFFDNKIFCDCGCLREWKGDLR